MFRRPLDMVRAVASRPARDARAGLRERLGVTDPRASDAALLAAVDAQLAQPVADAAAAPHRAEDVRRSAAYQSWSVDGKTAPKAADTARPASARDQIRDDPAYRNWRLQ